MNLIIPHKIANKYRYLLTRFKSTEWSGPAWYRVKTDEDGFPVEFKIVHFHPLDLGHGTTTEYDATDAAKIYRETYEKHPSLKKCYMGLIHSHHTMGAFLSGTDTGTIEDMAPEKGFYGSLVVASSGKELHAFGFGYQDQYKMRHCLKIDSDNIEVQSPQFKVEDEWKEQADIIEKNKPAVTVSNHNQVALWNRNHNVPNVNSITSPDKREVILKKYNKKVRSQVEAILIKNDAAEITDIQTEDMLQKLGVELLDVVGLMDDGYYDGYSYGGYSYGGY